MHDFGAGRGKGNKRRMEGRRVVEGVGVLG